MKKEKRGFLFWFPRVAAIVFIACMSISSLNVFGMGYTFRQTVGGLCVNLIPVGIMIVALVFSRKKYPIIGGIVFSTFGLRYILMNIFAFFAANQTGSMPSYYYFVFMLIIGIPALLIGIIFFLNRRKNKKL